MLKASIFIKTTVVVCIVSFLGCGTNKLYHAPQPSKLQNTQYFVSPVAQRALKRFAHNWQIENRELRQWVLSEESDFKSFNLGAAHKQLVLLIHSHPLFSIEQMHLWEKEWQAAYLKGQKEKSVSKAVDPEKERFEKLNSFCLKRKMEIELLILAELPDQSSKLKNSDEILIFKIPTGSTFSVIKIPHPFAQSRTRNFGKKFFSFRQQVRRVLYAHRSNELLQSAGLQGLIRVANKYLIPRSGISSNKDLYTPINDWRYIILAEFVEKENLPTYPNQSPYETFTALELVFAASGHLDFHKDNVFYHQGQYVIVDIDAPLPNLVIPSESFFITWALDYDIRILPWFGEGGKPEFAKMVSRAPINLTTKLGNIWVGLYSKFDAYSYLYKQPNKAQLVLPVDKLKQWVHEFNLKPANEKQLLVFFNAHKEQAFLNPEDQQEFASYFK